MKKKKNLIRTFISITIIFIIMFSNYQLLKIILDYRKSDVLYEETRDTFSKTVDEDDIAIDFDALQKINSDIVGWIFFEDVDISYPVLYSTDNEKYIRTAYNGEHMTAGSIFIDSSNHSDFSDSHTIIYGHNMKNLSMFGRLRYYILKPDYYKKHQFFKIITPTSCYRYQIFSCREVNAYSDAFTTRFKNGEAFVDFANKVLVSESSTHSEVNITDESKIITLSTCSNNDNRYIVSAIRVE